MKPAHSPLTAPGPDASNRQQGRSSRMGRTGISHHRGPDPLDRFPILGHLRERAQAHHIGGFWCNRRIKAGIGSQRLPARRR